MRCKGSRMVGTSRGGDPKQPEERLHYCDALEMVLISNLGTTSTS